MIWLRRLWCKIFHFPTYQMDGMHNWYVECKKCKDSWNEMD